MNELILVIDDKEKLCKSLQLNFKHLGYRNHYCLNGETALASIAQSRPDLILLDQALGDEDGLDVLVAIKQLCPEVPVIMITGFGSIGNAVRAMKIGAADYIQKPLNFERLHKIIDLTLRRRRNETSLGNARIITQNGTMLELLEKAKKLAKTDFPVLITGESGTGKEHFAHFIHAESTRAAHGMVCINCAAFPEDLLDNELFGHEKGAYTGADTQFQGVFERSSGGTLFMDEIGNMSLQSQAKILRTLQNNELRRIGGKETISVDVRFIGATNNDLHELMARNSFREDLYYRISTAVLHIPPLRNRKEDIIPLADYFLQDDASADTARSIDSRVIDLFMDYHWPGNVRELRNVMHYAKTMATGSAIQIDDLPHQLHTAEPYLLHEGSLKDHEKTLIIKALQEAHDNKKRAAEILNISRKTLYNKLEKYGLLNN